MEKIRLLLIKSHCTRIFGSCSLQCCGGRQYQWVPKMDYTDSWTQMDKKGKRYLPSAVPISNSCICCEMNKENVLQDTGKTCVLSFNNIFWWCWRQSHRLDGPLIWHSVTFLIFSFYKITFRIESQQKYPFLNAFSF